MFRMIIFGIMKKKLIQLLHSAGDLLERPMQSIDRLIVRMPVSSRRKVQFMEMKYGLIGTILFHMLVIFLFLVFQVGKTTKVEDAWIYFDLKTLEELAQLDVPVPELTPEQLADRRARNIAVTQEDRIENYDDYKNFRMSDRAVDQLVQSRINSAVNDIIKENDLNPDDRALPDLQTKPLDFYEAPKIEEDKVYEGPTNIYYNLDDRTVSYLHIPVYKGAGSATVRIDVRVGQRGKVELAVVSNEMTDTRDPCFLQAAKNAAQRTRFNFSTKAPLLQQGYIIYHFVAQQR